MSLQDSEKPDKLQILSDRLQLLGDISSRFDALTKETDEKLQNVTKTANILQQKMSPINEQMETLRHRRKGYEACKLFLKQTSSYQATTEKYIQEIHQTKINSVKEYVHSLEKAKESLDFFLNFLPQEKSAENLKMMIKEGTEKLAEKFREIVTSLAESGKFTREKCMQLATSEPGKCQDFMPKADKALMADLALISGWLDKEKKSSVYLNIYGEIRALALGATLKRLRDGLVGVTAPAYGASPSAILKPSGRDTPSKTRSIPRKPSRQLDQSFLPSRSGSLILDRRKSRTPQTGMQQPLLLEAAELPEMDQEELNTLITAFVRLYRLEFLLLKQHPFTVENPQALADQLIRKAKEAIIDDIQKFTASVRREFRDDPESLVRLVAVLDRLRQLRPELATALAPCSDGVRTEIDEAAREMQSQAYICLEDYRDEVVKDSRGEGWLLPPDGTVHEMTLQAMKFLQKLHEFDVTTFEILAKRPAGEQHDRKARSKTVGRYLSRTLANLLNTLDFRSEQYSDTVLRSIFLLNNYRYVYQSLNRENMTSTIEAFNCEASKFFLANQQKHRESYLNKGWARVLEIVMEKNKPLSQQRMASDMPGKLSDKEKALIKEKFKSFNEEFLSAYKTQSNYSVPDGELRQELIRENKEFLLDKYAMFRDKYSSVPFTSKKDKYIKYSRQDIEQMLDEFFRE